MAETQPPPMTATPLRLCPDCGGILEPSRPRWIATINMAAGATRPPAAASRWQCLICGYSDP